MIRHRLEATAAVGLDQFPRGLAYRNSARVGPRRAADFREPALGGHTGLAEGPVQEWLDRIAVIGFHVAELDIREESGRLQKVVAELARTTGLCGDYPDAERAAKASIPARRAAAGRGRPPGPGRVVARGP